MKRRIIDPDDGAVLATIQLDPFNILFTPEGRARGADDRFDGVDASPAMDTSEPPDGEDGTAAESWEDPDPEVVKNRVARIVQSNGWAAVGGE